MKRSLLVLAAAAAVIDLDAAYATARAMASQMKDEKAPAAAEAQPRPSSKPRRCFYKTIRPKDLCVYTCDNGQEYTRPAVGGPTFGDSMAPSRLMCPQIYIPF